MKKTRKLISFILIVTITSIILMSVLPITAVSSASIDNINYYYEGLSAEKAEQIVKLMVGVTYETITPASILCIFGHSIQTGTIITTDHNYYTTSPKCRETASYIEYCTRSSCSYYKVTDERTSRIGCH